MHSRIFQISKQPIMMEDYINESHFFDTQFLSSIADYVDGDTDRENDIRWLREDLKTAQWDGDSFIVSEEVRQEYFKPKYEQFKSFLDKAKYVALEDFSKLSEFDMMMYQLRESYEDKFGFYVVVSDCYGDEPITLDQFIREMEIGTRYYVGKTIDYHY